MLLAGRIPAGPAADRAFRSCFGIILTTSGESYSIAFERWGKVEKRCQREFRVVAANLRTLRALKSPERIQHFVDGLTYQYADTAWSPQRLLRERKGHCLEGALVATAALRSMVIRRC